MPRARARKNKKTQNQTVSKPTIWQALNEPVVEVSQDFARGVLLMAAFIIMMAWVLPYWNTTSAAASDYPLQKVSHSVQNQVPQLAMVAGHSSETTKGAPDWYYLIQRIANDVTLEFGQAAYDVLDISDPVQQTFEFYGPGIEAVWNAWLELMTDPQY